MNKIQRIYILDILFISIIIGCIGYMIYAKTKSAHFPHIKLQKKDITYFLEKNKIEIHNDILPNCLAQKKDLLINIQNSDTKIWKYILDPLKNTNLAGNVITFILNSHSLLIYIHEKLLINEYEISDFLNLLKLSKIENRHKKLIQDMLSVMIVEFNDNLNEIIKNNSENVLINPILGKIYFLESTALYLHAKSNQGFEEDVNKDLMISEFVNISK